MSQNTVKKISKKRAKGLVAGKKDERPNLAVLMESMDIQKKAVLDDMLKQFVVERNRQLKEQEAAFAERERKVRLYFANLREHIPQDVLEIKMSDMGSLEHKNNGYAISLLYQAANPPLDFEFTAPSPVPAKKNRQVFNDISMVSNSGKKWRRSSKRQNPDAAPRTADKKKIAKVASKPSQQLLLNSTIGNSSILNTSSKRTLRSTRKPAHSVKLAQQLEKESVELPSNTVEPSSSIAASASTVLADASDEVFKSVKTPGGHKMFKKPARKPIKDEQVIVVSKNGTPLLADAEWIKTRFRQPSEDDSVV